MTSARSLFVTTALPFANGPFHVGHIMEYIQADIWVRFQRMQGRKVHFVCADDTHGAAIMLKAESEGITSEQLIERIAAGRPKYLQGFHISFDNWHSTHSKENFELSQQIYRQLEAADLIYVEPVEQFYDPVKNMFLADRYIKGECPNCHSKDQYGDACEVCSSVYSPTELINPYSTLSGVTPVRKTSDHYFFRLSDPRCVEFLTTWIERLQPSVANKAREWLSGKGDQELKDWDISRDGPYFGIPIPDAPNKYFYVWLDAPIGYLASLKNYFDTGKARANGETRSFEDFIAADDVEQYHFIGKDIIYFHTLFWPAMLHFSGRKTPNNVYVHGFITLSGAKMSKSRGTGIDPLRYLDLGMNPEWLRYYIAAKLNANVEDIDFNPDDFVARVNSDLVGKYVNIASRAAPFLARYSGNRLTARAFTDANHWNALSFKVLTGGSDQPLDWIREWKRQARLALELIAEREFAKAIRVCMDIADSVNRYFDDNKPWILAKQGEQDRMQWICSVALEGFRIMTLVLKPVLPTLAEQAEAFLNLPEELMHSHLDASLPPGHTINEYRHLMTRAEPKQLDALLGIEEAPAKEAPVKPKSAAAPAADAVGQITVDDFAKLDLRVAKILAAEAVDGADKLIKLTLDIGDEQRTVFSGIRSAYEPQQLVGRHTVVLANLKPKKMRFGTSEGMVLSAGPGGKEIFLLSPDSGAAAGMKVT